MKVNFIIIKFSTSHWRIDWIKLNSILKFMGKHGDNAYLIPVDIETFKKHDVY